ncbi:MULTISPECIES: ABC transporter permease [Actinomyces]|uniref:ABC transporter permease n=1 Tax=Actinomyces respiraculi TaxID=2744574 RepID=A0A7T0LKK0_9ACTO|nr:MULTISPECIES: ABC transporter permease [Actinomyces]QPL04878.1 ABC transporter permease [Actinomyces respiraculi]
MATLVRYELVRLLRDKTLLMWALVLPLSLTVIFMAMFSHLDDSFAPTPMTLGVVEDTALTEAPGVSQVVETVSTGADRLIDPVPAADAEQALAAARAGDTLGYLDVTDGRLVLHLTDEGNATTTAPVLRAALDVWAQTGAQIDSLTAAVAAGEVSPDALAALPASGRGPDVTREMALTPVASSSGTGYYLSLLAFTSAMGMMFALVAVQECLAASGPTGARRTLAALPRRTVLAGVLLASWVAMTVCLLVALAVMVLVADVEMGPHGWLSVVAVVVSSLMSCAGGALLGTWPSLKPAIVSAVASFLSLFTGLYGPGAKNLADSLEETVPWLARANPLWHSSRAFYSLLYFGSLEPFVLACAAMTAFAVVFFVLALLRLRRTA